ncbi:MULTISPECIES: hypothetical protein [Nostoc]|uniref:Secreted protein n=1 Tax=Nostoc linckia FACHB-391 TaxID=2692906 RepID=A0ABR8F4J5_NOSLI|nr:MULTISPECIES: hypothetical protein [Nostoc]MBD2564546.1 hypothetical protein [Nostoc linckia FACHB-391]
MSIFLTAIPAVGYAYAHHNLHIKFPLLIGESDGVPARRRHRVGGFHVLEWCYALDVCSNVCCSKIRDYLGR